MRKLIRDLRIFCYVSIALCVSFNLNYECHHNESLPPFLKKYRSVPLFTCPPFGIHVREGFLQDVNENQTKMISPADDANDDTNIGL